MILAYALVGALLIIILFLITMFKTHMGRTPSTNNTVHSTAVNYKQTLQLIAHDIAALSKNFPQLGKFSLTEHVDSDQLVITYGYHTHRAPHRAGWTSGVPNPDDDGVWFFIDFHEPDSEAQIHTQPVTIDLCLAAKRVAFLVLEGKKTTSVQTALWTILQRHGVQRCN